MAESEPELNKEKIPPSKEIKIGVPASPAFVSPVGKELKDFRTSLNVLKQRDMELETSSSQEQSEENERDEQVSRQLALFNKGTPSAAEVSDALADLGFRSFHYGFGLKQEALLPNKMEGYEAEEVVRLEESRKLQDRMQKSAHQLFMKTAEIIYPDVISLGLTRASFADFENMARRLESEFPALLHVKHSARINKEDWVEAEKNPRLLLVNLDQMIDFASQSAFEAFQVNVSESGEDDKEKQVLDRQSGLAELNGLIYKMGLVRNLLQQKVYGRTDLSALEEAKIDLLKAKIELSEPSVEKPSEVTKFLDMMGKSEEQIEVNARSIVQRVVRPAIDAFRSVYPNQETMNQRLSDLLQELREEIKKVNLKEIIGKEKIESDNDRSYVVELVASNILYKKLLPKEQQALINAAKAEATRQDQINRQQGGSGGSFPPAPERLVSQLLAGLYERMEK